MHHFRRIILMCLLSWILGSRGGCICLWRSGESEPIWVSSYRVEYLPEADRSALNRGIPVHSREELARLMEDFLS